MTCCGFDYLKDKPWTRVAPRIMQSVALAEARESIDAGESEWLLIAVNSILRYIPQWLSEAPGRAAYGSSAQLKPCVPWQKAADT